MQEKLDIKILILFILRRLPETVESETLANLALSDGGVGYFEYAECLAELEDSGHLERQGRMIRLTEKGARNGSIVESSLGTCIVCDTGPYWEDYWLDIAVTW